MNNGARRRCVWVDERAEAVASALRADLGGFHPYVRAMGRGEKKPQPFRGVMCGQFPSAEVCLRCGTFSEVLCDWPMGEGKTCDAPLCCRCARNIGPELDLCPAHAVMFDRIGRMP